MPVSEISGEARVRAPRNQRPKRKLTRFPKTLGFAGANRDVCRGRAGRGLGAPWRPSCGKVQDCRIASRAQALNVWADRFRLCILFQTFPARKKPLRCSPRRLWTGLFRKSAERCARCVHTPQPTFGTEMVQIPSERLSLRVQMGCPPRRGGARAPLRRGRGNHRRNGLAGQARNRAAPPRGAVPPRTSPALRATAESPCPVSVFRPPCSPRRASVRGRWARGVIQGITGGRPLYDSGRREK